MGILPTRTIKVDVEVYVSRCEICGDEELAKTGGFTKVAPDGRPVHGDEPGSRLLSQGWSFHSHGEIRFSDNQPHSERDKREWRLCGSHLAAMKRRVADIVAMERAKLS